jgi:uncharacterized membrane protein
MKIWLVSFGMNLTEYVTVVEDKAKHWVEINRPMNTQIEWRLSLSGFVEGTLIDKPIWKAILVKNNKPSDVIFAYVYELEVKGILNGVSTS